MSDGFVWAAYLVTYGLIGGYVASILGAIATESGEDR